jgi:hypothetical protein
VRQGAKMLKQHRNSGKRKSIAGRAIGATVLTGFCSIGVAAAQACILPIALRGQHGRCCAWLSSCFAGRPCPRISIRMQGLRTTCWRLDRASGRCFGPWRGKHNGEAGPCETLNREPHRSSSKEIKQLSI